MIKFTVYRADTGEVLRTGACPAAMLDIQTGAGEQAIKGQFDADRYYIADGEPVEKPESPGPDHEWNPQARAWDAIPEAVLRASADAAARAMRRVLLIACDWTQLPDVPGTTKTAWAAYRQALRDITDQPGYPENIIWPTAPDQ